MDAPDVLFNPEAFGADDEFVVVVRGGKERVHVDMEIGN